jgi:hypothetical protein
MKPLLRLICNQHPGRTVAKVVPTPEGPVYRSSPRPFIIDGRPLLRDPLLRDGHEWTTMKRPFRRLPGVQDEMAVGLDLPEADRWSRASEYWGMLPGWCSECHREVWTEVETIRTCVRERRAILPVTV